MHGFFGFMFSMVLAGLAIAVGLVYVLVRLFRRDGGQDETQAEEARMIQEIYQGLSRMEERVESLETILLDADTKEGPR